MPREGDEREVEVEEEEISHFVGEVEDQIGMGEGGGIFFFFVFVLKRAKCQFGGDD